MTDVPASFQAQLEELRQEYTRALPEKLDEIISLWGAVQHDEGPAHALDQLIRKLHILAGSGATFGFPEITELSRSMEVFLRPFFDEGHPLNERDIAFITETIEKLNQQTISRSTHNRNSG